MFYSLNLFNELKSSKKWNENENEKNSMKIQNRKKLR